jgi:hypothetical protein
MPRIRKQVMVLRWVVVGYVAVACVQGQSPKGTHDEAPYFATPSATSRRGALNLRRDAANSGALWLRLGNNGDVFRYDPVTRTLGRAGAADWTRAQGGVADCAEQQGPDPGVLRLDSKTGRLSAGRDGRLIATAAPYVLTLRASPDGKWVAIGGGDGRGGSLLPALGSGGVTGLFRHEVLSLPDVKRRGPVVSLSERHRGEFLTPCWSADLEFVVYADPLLTSISIVETGIGR